MPTTSRLDRWLRGGLVSLIGLLAVALPVADLSARIPDPWWGPETLTGDAVVVALASGLIAGGCWLARREWERRHLTAVVVRTYAVAAGASVLFAWAIVLQLWSVGDPEPYVIALDGVLIAALTAFGTAVLHVQDSRLTEADRRTEAEYRALAEEVIDHSLVATAVVDADGRIVWLNRAAAATFGVDAEAATGADRETVIGAALEPTDRATAEGSTECRVRRESGEPRWVECSRHRIDDGLHAGGWIEQYTDVTEKREAIDALETLGDLPARTSDDEQTASEPIARTLDAGRESIDAEYAAFTRLDGEQSVAAVRAETADFDPTAGDSIPDLHTRSVRAVEAAEEPQTGARAVEPDAGSETDPETGGFEFDHGASGAFESYVAAPVVVDGDAVGVLTFLQRERTTVTAWQRAVADLLAAWTAYEIGTGSSSGAEAALAHERERLEFVNRIVRHNLLNGLNLLNARADLLDDGVEGAEAEEHLAVIRSRVDEMADLIDTIRAFMDAALSEGERALEPVPIRTPLEDRLAAAAERYDAEFRVRDLPDPELEVAADDVVGEVVENVLSNAVEHNDAASPTVEVRTTRSAPETAQGSLAGEQAAMSDGGEPQSTLTVHVADDGPGIPEAEKRRLLTAGGAELSDPGHGFGLYLVRELMESYGGEVRIRDNEPRGTVVDLTFPIAATPDRRTT